MDFYILLISFFIIALIYSSVGFGGGSSYLALLALPVFALVFPVIRSTALFCNIIVVTGGIIIFYREGKLSLRESWPYLISSVPMAYVGGFWPIQEQTFFVLLGVTLVIVPFLLWFQNGKTEGSGAPGIPETNGLKLALGGAIGLLSGLVGIGGGIFLSPILHMLRWSEPKRISAIASLFILVNSISGMIGLMSHSPNIPKEIPFFAIAAVIGGLIGAEYGSRRIAGPNLKRLLAVVLIIAGIKMVFS